MIARVSHVRDVNVPTTEEWRAVFQTRLEALEDATRAATWGDPLPIPWRVGWKATVAILGRDKDGSLLFTITCTGPKLDRPYVRKARLCKKHPLPSRLATE